MLSISSAADSINLLDLRLRKLLTTIVLLWVFVVATAFVSGYHGQTWSESLVFKVSDGWCNDTIDGVGDHCFGDFGLGYFQGDFGDEFEVDYVPENFITTNTPMTIVLFKALGRLGFDTALVIYLSLLAVSVLFPLFHATRDLDALYRCVAIVFGGALSYGLIATLDRGNHIGLLVTPAYFYVLALEQHRSDRTILWGVILAVLKFWGGLFFLPLLINKRIREFMLSVLLTLIGYLAPLSFFQVGFWNALTTMFRVNSSNTVAAITAPYNISANGFAQRIACAINRDSWCNTTDPANQFPYKGIITLFVLILLTTCLVVIIRAFRDLPLIGLGSLMAVPQFVIPDSALYTTAFSSCLLALAFRWGRGSQNQVQIVASKHPYLWKSLYLVLIITIVPISFSMSSFSWLASSNGSANPEFKIQYWLYPIAWFGFFVMCTVAAIRELVESKSNILRHQMALSTPEQLDNQA